jgi:DNA-binding transcriptional LysR family regulator
MHGLHINTLDLNLLRVFDVLLEERSVTRAGARLGLSQSAVSHSLKRLRESLGDELFVRSREGMQPTLRARELGAQVHAGLSQLQAAFAPPAFDPALTTRRFVISAGSYACAVLAPALVERMTIEAPDAQLAITAADGDVLERLDSRRVDFVIGGVASAPDRLAYESLLKETLVWVVRADSPHARGPDALEDVMAMPHVIVSREVSDALEGGRAGPQLSMRASWEDFGAHDAAVVSGARPRRRIGVTVPDTYSALAVVRRSDMAALIPRRLARFSADIGQLRIVEPSREAPTVDLSLLVLRDRLAEPAIAWMRGLVRATAAGF